MNWFKTERNDATQAADGQPTLNALDRLTQSAAVAVSRRGFLKKLGVGTVVGLGFVAGARQAAASSCPTLYDCVQCHNGWMSRWRYQEATKYGCEVVRTEYGPCGNCPI